jgi:hypothetical protein
MLARVTRPRTIVARPEEGNYGAMLADLVALVAAARHNAVRSVNTIMTATYWAVGRRIVEHEQHGSARAEYGGELIGKLSRDLRARFGRGFGRANLFQMRGFYLAYRDIFQFPSGNWGGRFRPE